MSLLKLFGDVQSCIFRGKSRFLSSPDGHVPGTNPTSNRAPIKCENVRIYGLFNYITVTTQWWLALVHVRNWKISRHTWLRLISLTDLVTSEGLCQSTALGLFSGLRPPPHPCQWRMNRKLAVLWKNHIASLDWSGAEFKTILFSVSAHQSSVQFVQCRLYNLFRGR